MLASRSPRRSELLRAAGFDFTVRVAEVDESIEPGESPDKYVLRLAEEKALAVDIADGEVILGADTTVALGNEILGKPADGREARDMLNKLSGQCHAVYTGVCLRTENDVLVDFSRTDVWFERMGADEIEAYVASGEPFDKAGAYAIQGRASRYIPRIEGSYSNVVGLPIDLVYRLITRVCR